MHRPLPLSCKTPFPRCLYSFLSPFLQILGQIHLLGEACQSRDHRCLCLTPSADEDFSKAESDTSRSHQHGPARGPASGGVWWTNPPFPRPPNSSAASDMALARCLQADPPPRAPTVPCAAPRAAHVRPEPGLLQAVSASETRSGPHSGLNLQHSAWSTTYFKSYQFRLLLSSTL